MTELALPKIDKDTISRKDQIVSHLKKFTKDENILSENEEIKPYETDGLAAYKQTPLAVVLPENTKEVSEILKFCNEENIKVIPRCRKTKSNIFIATFSKCCSWYYCNSSFMHCFLTTPHHSFQFQ